MGERREVAVFVGLLVFIGVSYMLHRIYVRVMDAWDTASDWAKAHQFWAGFTAGLAVAVIVRLLV